MKYNTHFQEMLQSQNKDQPTSPQGRATENLQSQDINQAIKLKQQIICLPQQERTA